MFLAGRIALLIASACLVGFVHQRMPAASRADQGEPFVPRPEVARATSLGFRAVMADYYWLRAVQIVGAAAVPQAHGPLLGRLIDVVTTLNPWVDHPYRFAAVWLTEGEDQVRQANRLLARGIEHHPDDWRNHFYLGFNHFYYLGDDAPPRPTCPGGSRRSSPRTRRPIWGRLVARSFANSTRPVSIRPSVLPDLQLIRTTTEDPYAQAEYDEGAGRDRDRASWLGSSTSARAEYCSASATARTSTRVEDLARRRAARAIAHCRRPIRTSPMASIGSSSREDRPDRVELVLHESRYEPRIHRLDRERRDRGGVRQVEAEAS